MWRTNHWGTRQPLQTEAQGESPAPLTDEEQKQKKEGCSHWGVKIYQQPTAVADQGRNSKKKTEWTKKKKKKKERKKKKKGLALGLNIIAWQQNPAPFGETVRDLEHVAVQY